MAALKDRITDDMRAAMRAKDAPRLSAIRMLTAAIKQREVDDRKDLTDADVIGIVDKLLKQRRDSITQFEQGGRQDLADHEKFEVSVLEAYMPQALSEAEVTAAIAAAVAESGAKAPADMGKVMALLKPRLAGRTDMSKVSGLVKAQLSAGA